LFNNKLSLNTNKITVLKKTDETHIETIKYFVILYIRNISEIITSLVYKIHCKDCDVSYVGQTKRQLRTRIKEHRNNIKLDESKHSVISEHMLSCNYSFDWNQVRILDTEFITKD